MTDTNRFINKINQETENHVLISNAIANLSEENRAFALSFIGFDNLASILKDTKTAKEYCKNLHDQTQASINVSNKTIRIVNELSKLLFGSQSTNTNKKAFGLFGIGKDKSNEH